jgi:leucyl aminopeptidase
VFESIRIASARSPLAVLAVFAGEEKLPAHLKSLDTATNGALSAAIKTPGFKADPGEATPAGRDHLLLGLGKRDELKPETLRTIGGRLVKRLDRMAVKAARLAISEAINSRSISPQAAGCCVAEGIALGNWRVDAFDGAATKKEPAKPPIAINADDKSFRSGMEVGLLLADCQNYARALAATPPNICNPPWVAQQAKKLAGDVGLTCRVIDFRQAQRLGMGGLVNVGKASVKKPCMVILEHSPRKVASSARGKTIALVGKTLTYDTGGYSLKIQNSMKGMKYDKCGGMAVLGAMRAIALRKTPVRVVALLPCAENMVSGEAYRPDDIITLYNKVSVEVTNTDAEGRLVLADALAYACDKYKPSAIIDAATLTGGVIVTFGRFCSGVFCNDDDLLARVMSAAETTGERAWHLPLWPEHKDFMRAKHADILNSNPTRQAQPIAGAAFLAFFVDENIPWAHIDIAGMSDVDADTDLFVTGPTGYGTRLIAETVNSFVK